MFNLHQPTNYHYAKTVKASKLIMTKYFEKARKAILARESNQVILDHLYQAKEYAPTRYWWRALGLYNEYCKKFYPQQ